CFVIKIECALFIFFLFSPLLLNVAFNIFCYRYQFTEKIGLRNFGKCTVDEFCDSSKLKSSALQREHQLQQCQSEPSCTHAYYSASRLHRLD
ncbi:MAG TPA: hypothetical protein VHL14_14695, partial [Steroidobacteraceae bacterium]|nr:hypothetical protein [Steroidobacteraceae bacterium]